NCINNCVEPRIEDDYVDVLDILAWIQGSSKESKAFGKKLNVEERIRVI
ncbi:hypothetical protein Tco_1450861, partial [Tanacetum coccineum]